ncbi:acetyl-CoA carboxylase biotin carboxyl carrier protein [Nostocaceae cyanobacterium CENA357]|uniref:Biotin carboxyl carrier protein of acetyl-CoA carboxylase n=1 Tax=Atlanticothrix silvestris CENA357 TaxID=1725252 RepID=A0A8J7L2F6_9CYAN|nr:acetyl-CoA carboxylase biotin carboxyl carrier protein [Atlanticothrix silvestris]MBH8553179.1 acetyl-CoA carboxylase biotin carboxyl carrier protein [Atlanticothrix silvestris CENA357]
MPLDFNELNQLLVTIAESDFAELTLKTDDFELTVRKAVGVSEQLLPGNQLESQGNIVAAAPSTLGAAIAAAPNSGINMAISGTVGSTGSAAIEQLTIAASLPMGQKLVDMVSPMVGTFYSAPAPSEPPFVEVGDRIKAGQTVCIIEAMKLMNEIEAEVSGQIVEILVQNGSPVEFGQQLVRIKPD